MSLVSEMVNVDGTLFFVTTPQGGYELWKSDGSAAGTVLLKQFSGPLSS